MHDSNFVTSDKKSAKCQLCSKMFYKTSIKKHIRIIHQGLKPHTCDICNKGFVSKANLENHTYLHNKDPTSRPFKCHICPKSFVRNQQLTDHFNSHKGIKPFICKVCGIEFTNKSNWKRHRIEHNSKTKEFKCITCGREFARQYYLVDHVKTHTGEKPYFCVVCGSCSATRSNFNSHMKTHKR